MSDHLFKDSDNNTKEVPTVTAAIAAEKAKAAMQNGTPDEAQTAASVDPADRYKDLPVDEDGIREFIRKDMLIGDVIEIYPSATKALLSVGMHCITCGVAIYETVEEASYVHGLDPDDVVKVVNDMLTTELIEHPGE
ncbi:MAG: DUF1858 domain-containing protein [Eubacterium sp.]|nr:DUF1858 domain-containing protein [Eubacterium sp.]